MDTASVTPRQIQVLQLLATDLSADLVAQQLGITACTVRKHLERIHKTLEVHSNLAAYRKLLQSGIMELE